MMPAHGLKWRADNRQASAAVSRRNGGKDLGLFPQITRKKAFVL
jgi:hypothetical protein